LREPTHYAVGKEFSRAIERWEMEHGRRAKIPGEIPALVIDARIASGLRDKPKCLSLSLKSATIGDVGTNAGSVRASVGIAPKHVGRWKCE
jgi:hypothetical protein